MSADLPPPLLNAFTAWTGITFFPSPSPSSCHLQPQCTGHPFFSSDRSWRWDVRNSGGNSSGYSCKSPPLILKICGNFFTQDLMVKDDAMLNDESVYMSAFLNTFFSWTCTPQRHMLLTISSLQSSLPSPPSDYPQCSRHNCLLWAAPTPEFLPAPAKVYNRCLLPPQDQPHILGLHTYNTK